MQPLLSINIISPMSSRSSSFRRTLAASVHHQPYQRTHYYSLPQLLCLHSHLLRLFSQTLMLPRKPLVSQSGHVSTLLDASPVQGRSSSNQKKKSEWVQNGAVPLHEPPSFRQNETVIPQGQKVRWAFFFNFLILIFFRWDLWTCRNLDSQPHPVFKIFVW